MAKSNRTAISRIAATVNARYYPSSGATDMFYLDGRLTGRREHRAADITVDREDRGFFYSVFAHLGSQHADEVANTRLRKSLDRILTDVKQHGRNIDAEINELAECAVDIARRMTLQHEGVRQPYFSGIIVKDSEIAAITMGGGCAYLYRGDVLYPLTNDDFPLDAIDLNGRNVPGHDVYCAGVAGTVRYSNIAQLQEDDCVIVCNRDVMEALGQREVLRLLYEAEDQADAAGLIITAAAAKLPGVPLQIMIGFVEAINMLEKTGRIPFGRGVAEPASIVGPTAGTRAGGRSAASVPAVKPDSGTVNTNAFAGADDEDVHQYEHSADYSENNYVANSDDDDLYATNEDEDGYDHHDDYIEDEMQRSGKGRQIAFYLILAAICIGCLFAIYNMIFKGDDKETIVTTTTVNQSSIPDETTKPSDSMPSESTMNTEPSDTTEPVQTGETTAPAETTQPTTAETTAAAGDLIATHTVAEGETLWSIASQYYPSDVMNGIEKIKSANSLTSEVVNIGQSLKIPQ
jgi:LysM repeat protein